MHNSVFSGYTFLDYYALAVALCIVLGVIGGFLGTLVFLSRRKSEKAIYIVVIMGFVCHFAVWGVAEWYLINGFWYVMNFSPVQTIDIAYWSMAWGLSIVPLAVMVLALTYFLLSGFVGGVGAAKRIAEGLAKGDLAVEDGRLVSRVAGGVVLAPLAGREAEEAVERWVKEFVHVFFGWKLKSKSALEVFTKVLLSVGSGWTIGNVIQDRVCGLLSCWVQPSLWWLYLSFMGDPVGALLKWILPIVVFNVFSFWYVFWEK